MLRFLPHALLATLSLAAAPFAPFFRWLARSQERELEQLTALRERLERNEMERARHEQEQTQQTIFRPVSEPARQQEHETSRTTDWQAARDAMARRNDELRRERQAREVRDHSQADPGRTREPPRFG